jgi:hypothetical protein
MKMTVYTKYDGARNYEDDDLQYEVKTTGELKITRSGVQDYEQERELYGFHQPGSWYSFDIDPGVTK